MICNSQNNGCGMVSATNNNQMTEYVQGQPDGWYAATETDMNSNYQRTNNANGDFSTRQSGVSHEDIPRLEFTQMTEYLPPQSNQGNQGSSSNSASQGGQYSQGEGSVPLPQNPAYPEGQPLLPNAPTFNVPNNPLLPPGFQEILSYDNLQYLNGFLRTQIGKYMRIEQLVGSNMVEDRFGFLVGVGSNYVLLQEIGTGNILALDYYNIKYVYIYHSVPQLPTNS